jgi:tetratricopeptide (TPR) repeat protein
MKRFFEELRQRGVFRAAGLYIALTWLLLQIGDVVFPAFDIPDASLRFILFGAIGGFPIAMLVSWFYDISSDGIRSEDEIREAGEKRSRGVVSTLTIVFLVLALATSLFANFKQANDAQAPPSIVSILVADFTNGTGEEIFDGSLESTLVIGIERAPFVNAFGPNRVPLIAERLSPSMALDETTALQIALREGYQLVLAGSIQPDGNAYGLSLRAVNPEDGEIVFDVETSAESSVDVLPAIARLAIEVREELGDSSLEDPDADSADILASASLEAARFYAIAQAHAASDQHEEATEFYARAVEKDPGFGMAYSASALSAQKLGQREQSQQLWQQALQQLDGMTERQRYRTLGLYATHAESDYDKAIENYISLVEKYPSEVIGRDELAVAYFNAHQFDKALQQIASLAARYASNTAYRARYALYAMYAGEFDTARKQSEKVLKSDPGYFLAYVPLAMAELAQGDTAAAENIYLRMASLGVVASSMASTGRADIALLQGDYAAAIALLEAGRAADIDSGNTEAAARKAVYRATALQGLGDNAAAIKLLEDVLPAIENQDKLLTAGLLMVELGELDRAGAVGAQLASKNRKSGLANAELLAGKIALAEGRAVSAVDALTASLALVDSWLARFVLGQAYATAGYQAEALGEFKHCEDRLGDVTALFLDDIPTFQYSAPLYYWLAKTKQQLGMSREAVTDYEKYLALRVATDMSQRTLDARARLGELSAP